MYRFLPALLLAGVAAAQQQTPDAKDPLGRTTPQDSVFNFLETCHTRDYTKATRYFDLRKMPPAQRAKDGPELTQQLEDLLDDTSFDITTLSRDPEGDESDGLSADVEHLATFQVAGQPVELQLERVQLRPGFRVWLVSSDSVAMIPKAHQSLGESPFEKRLPQALVDHEVLDTPIWRWIALFIMAAVLWMSAGVLSRVMVRALGRLEGATKFRLPLQATLAVAGFRAALELAPPATLSRTFVERALGMAFFLALAAIGAAIVDLIAHRWRSHLDPREQAVSYSVLPLGRQVVKLSLFLIAILGVLSVWGYNTSTILAGLGVGGLAVALAAQKTIENLFGGISVIGDRPVLVGDKCRFGDRIGWVTHIGLRSTLIRTEDRTMVSVPNAQFSGMELENISSRDKFWFHPILSLRRDTTSDQLLRVLAAFREVLARHPKLETGKIPVRFIGVGPYSLDVQLEAHVKTADEDEFRAVQQELLIEILKAVESAGTALAVPIQENFEPQRAQKSPAPRDGASA